MGNGVAFGSDDLGSGGLNDVDVTVVNPRFVMYRYRNADGTVASFEGKEMQVSPFAHIPFRTEDGGLNEYTYLQVGSAGSFRPVGTDGSEGSSGSQLELVPADEGGIGQKKVNKNSKFGFFMNELHEMGYFKTSDDISDMDGLQGHLVPKDKPKSKEPIPVFSSVVKESVGTGAGKTKASGKGKDKSKAKDEPEFDQSELEATIKKALEGADDNRLSMVDVVTKHLDGRDQKWQKTAVGLIYNNGFCEGDERPWTCEDNVLTLKG